MAYTTIDDPSAYFHTQLFTGNGSTQSITNDANAGDFKPDWLWIKSRGTTHGHAVFDSNRGGNARLASEGTQEERTNEGNVTFQTDGFNVTSSHPTTNNNSTNMVAWQWKANGGTTTTNSAGANGADHESVYQANDTAGFSIVTYTSDAASGDTVIKHGLSTAPTFMIHKARNAGSTLWWVYHKDLTNDGYMQLDDTTANQDGSTNVWRNTAPTSTVFKVGLNSIANANGRTMVAYCFAPIQGYSKFGSYKGNGSTDGPFAYTGFKPAWVMIKRTDSTSSWHMWDNKREDYNGNPNDSALRADADGAENDTTDYSIDFLSNGFKLRNASDLDNNSSGTFIYMAFAESPFVSSKGVPTTAR